MSGEVFACHCFLSSHRGRDILFLWRVHGGCILLASMSGSFESKQWTKMGMEESQKA